MIEGVIVNLLLILIGYFLGVKKAEKTYNAYVNDHEEVAQAIEYVESKKDQEKQEESEKQPEPVKMDIEDTTNFKKFNI